MKHDTLKRISPNEIIVSSLNSRPKLYTEPKARAHSGIICFGRSELDLKLKIPPFLFLAVPMFSSKSNLICGNLTIP